MEFRLDEHNCLEISTEEAKHCFFVDYTDLAQLWAIMQDWAKENEKSIVNYQNAESAVRVALEKRIF